VSLGQHLEGLVLGLRHHGEHVLDELERDALVKEI